MSIHPQPLNQFFDASNTNNREVFIRCFSDDAIVKDEGKTHLGKPAISAWNDNAISTYQCRYQIVDSRLTPLGADVVVMVSGSFPGSPLQLTFKFILQHNLISQLEITV